MLDQSRVQSGFDAEALLGSRYFAHLLLLAADVGILPASVSFGTTTIKLMAPKNADRTYDAHPDAPFLETSSDTDNDALAVEVLVNHPTGADLKVTLVLEVITATLDVPNLGMNLYFTLGLERVPADDGGLGSITVATTLVDVDGAVVDAAMSLLDPPVTKDEIITRLTPYVNRNLDLGSTGSGGRLEGLEVRRYAADADHDSALGLYLNLRLKAGPQPDNYVGPRGAVLDSVNLLSTGTDVAFATRADLYGFLGPDAQYRRAELHGSDYSYPIRRHPSDPTSDVMGQLLDITVRPPDPSDSTPPPDPTTPRVPGGVQPPPPPTPGGYLNLIVHGDYSIDWFPDPDYRLYVYLFGDTDDDEVMSWGSDSDFEAGILVDIIFGVLSLALIPVLGPWSLAVFTGLELAKYGTDKIVSAAVIDDRVQAKVDAGVLDIAPNRFTIVRRRWDPFYETHHQIGLRAGEVDINSLGMAMTGPAVVTRQPHVVTGSVIREAVRDDAGALVGLGYRVRDVEDYRALVDVVAPATDRGDLMPDGRTTDHDLLAITVDDAVGRVAAQKLESNIDLHVVRVEMDEHTHTVSGLLLLSLREFGDLREDLAAAHQDAARQQITADQSGSLHDQVVQEFEDQGRIATPAEVDAEVAARIDALVAADEQAYESGALAVDLARAADAAATLVLSPAEAGRLQQEEVLVVHDFDPIHVRATDRWYFRDRYVRSEEPTRALRLADNLVNRPRFRRSSAGLVEF